MRKVSEQIENARIFDRDRHALPDTVTDMFYQVRMGQKGYHSFNERAVRPESKSQDDSPEEMRTVYQSNDGGQR